MGKKLKDRDLAREVRSSWLAIVMANFLIALSGFVLYSDKVFSFLAIQLSLPDKWEKVEMDQETFVWFVSQTFSPIIWALGTYIHRWTFMHFVPLYCYVLQLYFIFRDYAIVDNTYLNYYVVGTTIITAVGFHGIKWLLRRRAKKELHILKDKLRLHGKETSRSG